MGELMDWVKERYFGGNSKNTTRDLIKKQKVKNAIIAVCNENLTEAGDTFEFEVKPADLQYATAVIAEEPLKSKYIIYQISETMFSARLQELELF